MKSIARTLLVTAAIALAAPAAVSAAEGPPAQAPGCQKGFAPNAAPILLANPALEAFTKQHLALGGIGPCFAPHPGGR